MYCWLYISRRLFAKVPTADSDLITFKCEQKLSDEILANPSMTDEITRTKRSRERKIEEAFLQVEQWRYFYREGTINEHVATTLYREKKLRLILTNQLKS